MNRAQFLVAAALASTGLRDVLRRPASAEAAAGPRPGTWDAIRGEFALAPGVTQLSAFLLASHPRPVREAIERHRRGLDANPHGYLDHAASFEERARRSAAQSLGSQPSQVALTDSTTMGLGLLYGGLRLEAGDDVLTTVHDFYSTHAALEFRAAATGARVRKISLYRDLRHVSEAEIVASVAAALRPETRYVAVTWVHSSTGLKLPIRQIAAAVRRANASRPAGRQIRLCVDGVHGFGVEPEPVASLGCDFFVSGCHKWLFGPRGTGLVWAKDPAWAGASEIIPIPPADRQRADRCADPRARRATQGGAGEAPRRSRADSRRSEAFVRPRLLHRRRARSKRFRAASLRQAPHRRERHAVCPPARALRPNDRQQPRGDRPNRQGRSRADLGPAAPSRYSGSQPSS